MSKFKCHYNHLELTNLQTLKKDTRGTGQVGKFFHFHKLKYRRQRRTPFYGTTSELSKSPETMILVVITFYERSQLVMFKSNMVTRPFDKHTYIHTAPTTTLTLDNRLY